MIRIVYNGKTVDDKDTFYDRTLDTYDLIILRQALKCQANRTEIVLSPDFKKVYTKKLAELFEIVDSNMTNTIIEKNDNLNE